MTSSLNLQGRLHRWLTGVGWRAFPFASAGDVITPLIDAREEGEELEDRFVEHVILPIQAAQKEVSGFDLLLAQRHTILLADRGEGKTACRLMAEREAAKQGHWTIDYPTAGAELKTAQDHASFIAKELERQAAESNLQPTRLSANPFRRLEELVRWVNQDAAKMTSGIPHVMVFVDDVDKNLRARLKTEVTPEALWGVLSTLFDTRLLTIKGLHQKFFLPSGLRDFLDRYLNPVNHTRKKHRSFDLLQIQWTKATLHDLIALRLRSVSTTAEQLQSIAEESDFTDLDLEIAEKTLSMARGSSAETPRRALKMVHAMVLHHVQWSQSDAIRLNRADLEDALREARHLGRELTSVPKSPLNTGKSLAVLVGVNQYEDESIPNLKAAVADVTALRVLLEGQYETVTLVTDDKLPTYEVVLNTLYHTASSAAKNDLLLFYFCGHGVFHDGKSYLLPRNARIGVGVHTYVPMEIVRMYMEQAQARAKVIVLDTCHAGLELENNRGLGMSPEFIRDVFEQAKGMVILSSCRRHEVSYEWVDKGHGVFTFFLMEALKGNADHEKKGYVTIRDVHRYVRWNVGQWAHGRNLAQTPTLEERVDGEIILLKIETARDNDFWDALNSV
jgi:hypothetical protein